MKRGHAFIIVALGLLYFVGCHKSKPAAGKDPDLDALWNQTVQDDHERRIHTLEVENMRTAYFQPDDRTVTRLDTRSGIFLIGITDIKPYLDGYKITLKIGNISSATYEGINIHISMGSKDFKDIALPTRLRAGAFSRAEIIYRPATTTDLSNGIGVAMSVDQVLLK